MKNHLLIVLLFLFSINLTAQTITSDITLNQNYLDNASWPITIGTGVVVTFGEDVMLDDINKYFIIQGDNVIFNGDNHSVTINNVVDYPGLLQNGSAVADGFNNVTVQNISVLSNNTSLDVYGGWIGQAYFGYGVTNNSFNNCSSNGDIRQSGGGIMGGYSTATANHCHSTGFINDGAGGIAGEQSNGAITYCYSLGNMANSSGGIFGNISSGNANNCYSTGSMGWASGGIMANGNFGTATDCYSLGDMADYSGGIFGAGGAGVAINCYSRGAIGTLAGGIMGAYNSGTVANCFSTGSIDVNGGGIAGYTFYGTSSNSYFTNGGTWDDASAMSALIGTDGSVWTDIDLSSNTPYKLSSFNAALYSPGTQTIPANPLINSPTGDFNTGTYSIVSINNASTSDYPSVSINSVSGMMTFTNTGTGSYASKIVYTDNADGSYQISDYSLTITTSLPVTWRSFTVTRRQDNAAWLQWGMVTEQHTRDFAVQHSINGNSWTTIGTVTAAGNSNGITNYSYLHTHAVTGNNYYRILQTDQDGKYNYSSVKTLKFTSDIKNFSVVNNVVNNGMLQVSVNATDLLKLYDSDGKLIWQKQINAGVQNIDLSAVPKGLYFLKGKDAVEKILVSK